MPSRKQITPSAKLTRVALAMLISMSVLRTINFKSAVLHLRKKALVCDKQRPKYSSQPS